MERTPTSSGSSMARRASGLMGEPASGTRSLVTSGPSSSSGATCAVEARRPSRPSPTGTS
jgi:hypothetical protein